MSISTGWHGHNCLTPLPMPQAGGAWPAALSLGPLPSEQRRRAPPYTTPVRVHKRAMSALLCRGRAQGATADPRTIIDMRALQRRSWWTCVIRSFSLFFSCTVRDYGCAALHYFLLGRVRIFFFCLLARRGLSQRPVCVNYAMRRCLLDHCGSYSRTRSGRESCLPCRWGLHVLVLHDRVPR